MKRILSRLASSIATASKSLPGSVTPDDVVLASFPKSGNTWLRFIFANLLREANGIEAGVDFFNIESYSPAVGGVYELPKTAGILITGSRLIKTHQAYSRRYGRLRSLLLVRAPSSCIPSYYEYLSVAHGKALPPFSKFARGWRWGIPAWCNFHRIWVKKADLVVRYEDLALDPHAVVLSICQFFNLPYDSGAIDRALAQSSRQRMTEAELLGDPYHSAGYTFVSDGAPRAVREIVSAADAGYLTSAPISLLRAIDARVMRVGTCR